MSKFYQNILQNAPNCTIYKKFSGEHAPKPASVLNYLQITA